MQPDWNKAFVTTVLGILSHPAPAIAYSFQKAMREFLDSGAPHYFVEQEVADAGFIAALAVANMYLIGSGSPDAARDAFLAAAGDILIEPDVNPLMDFLDKRPAK